MEENDVAGTRVADPEEMENGKQTQVSSEDDDVMSDRMKMKDTSSSGIDEPEPKSAPIPGQLTVKESSLDTRSTSPTSASGSPVTPTAPPTSSQSGNVYNIYGGNVQFGNQCQIFELPVKAELHYRQGNQDTERSDYMLGLARNLFYDTEDMKQNPAKYKELVYIFQTIGSVLLGVRPGCIEFRLGFSEVSSLVQLWKTRDELARDLENVLITPEIRKAVNDRPLQICLTIDSDEYQRGLRLLSLQDSTKSCSLRPMFMRNWSPDHVRDWLTENGIDEKYVTQFYEEEVDGRAMIEYEDKDLADDFSLKKAALRKILYARKRQLENETLAGAVSSQPKRGGKIDKVIEQTTVDERFSEETESTTQSYSATSEMGDNDDKKTMSVLVTANVYNIYGGNVQFGNQCQMFELPVKAELHYRQGYQDTEIRDFMLSLARNLFNDTEDMKQNPAKYKELVYIFQTFGSVLQGVRPGCIEFRLGFREASSLVQLWKTRDELARDLENVLITPEIRKAVNDRPLQICLTIDSDEYQRGLRLLSLQDSTKSCSLRPMFMRNWSPDHVRDWLTENGIDEKYVTQFYEEEVDGRAMIEYEDKDLADDFSLKKAVLRKILYARKRQLENETLAGAVSSQPKRGGKIDKVIEQTTVDERFSEEMESTTQSYSATSEMGDNDDKKTMSVLVSEKPVAENPEQESYSCSLVPGEGGDGNIAQAEGSRTEQDVIGKGKTGKKKRKKKKKKSKADNGGLDTVDDTKVEVPVSQEDKSDDVSIDGGHGKESRFKTEIEKDDAIADDILVTKTKQYTPTLVHEKEECSIESRNIKSEVGERYTHSKASFAMIPDSDKVESVATNIEDKMSGKTTQISVDQLRSPTYERKELATRLKNLLCGGSKQIDDSFYPLLVINKPSDDLGRAGTERPLVNCLNFIGSVKWVGVFDFDAESYDSGSCNIFRQKNDIKAQLPHTFHNIRDIIRFRDGIRFPEVTTWIFANGRSDMEEEEMVFDRRKWNAERSSGVEDAISFFAKPEVIPDTSRATILFLILSDDLDIMSDTFRKFYSSFGIDRIACIAEKEEHFKKWVQEVEKWCPRQKIEERSVVGMPWEDVQECLMRIQGVVQQSDLFLPTSTGSRCPLSERDRSRWSDLSILCQNECENTDMNDENPNFEEFAKSMELDFYRGQKVSWWNFHLSDKQYNQVLKRDIHEQLYDMVDNALKGSRDMSPIVTQVRLFHQPGAGGSTLARHILWDFHKNYRCVAVNRITPNTWEQILELRKYKEADTSECLPVIVLVEDCEDIEVNELIYCLGSGLKATTQPSRHPHTILLHCKRVHSTYMHVKRYPDKSMGLDQALSTSESKWFSDKYKELDSKKAMGLQEYNPDRLVSFMVMKDNFKKDYVENLVSGIMKEISTHKEELKVLQYSALMNKFEPDSAIPVACLDGVMGVGYLARESAKAKYASREPWEFHLSDSAQILVLKVHVAPLGGVYGIKIVHPIVADEVLKQLCDTFMQTTANTALEYINSQVFKSSSHSKEYLVNKTHDMLIKRKKMEFGDERDTEFSELIEHICDSEGTKKAAEVLKCGFHVLEDPLIGQHLARMLYLREKNFEEAHKYAEEAENLVPKNSYVLDTRGQIFKHEIKYHYEEKYCKEQETLPIEKTHHLIQLAFEGIRFFRKSQDANLEEKNSENNAGFFGEVDVTFLLLQILESMNEFHGSRGLDLLHAYLVTDETPKVLGSWAQYHRDFKALRHNVERAIDWISNYVTYNKVGSSKALTKEVTPLDRMKYKLDLFHREFARYFGEPKEMPIDVGGNVENANDWRRRQVIYLGGNTFHKIFDIAKMPSPGNVDKLLNIRELLAKNKPPNAFDLQNLLCVDLAISSLPKHTISQKVTTPPLKEAIDMAKSLHHLLGPDKLYGLYFLSMFLWPRESLQDLNDPDGFLEYVDALRTRWDMMQKRSKDPPQQSYSYQKALRQKPMKKRPLTYFFLAKNRGLREFVHINWLNTSAGKVEHERDQFWESHSVVERLIRIEGMLKNSVSAIARVSVRGKAVPIAVRLAEPRDDIISQEPVTFYLGFSWSGPTAFDVKPKEGELTFSRYRYTTEGESMTRPHSSRIPLESVVDPSIAHFDYERYKKEHKKLERKLRDIEDLERRRRNGEKLEAGQLQKIRAKDTVLKDLADLKEKYKRHMYVEDTI